MASDPADSRRLRSLAAARRGVRRQHLLRSAAEAIDAGRPPRDLARSLGITVAHARRVVRSVERSRWLTVDTPKTIIHEYAVGWLTSKELIERLADWPYDFGYFVGTPGAEEYMPGSWDDVKYAHAARLIDDRVYAELARSAHANERDGRHLSATEEAEERRKYAAERAATQPTANPSDGTGDDAGLYAVAAHPPGRCADSLVLAEPQIIVTGRRNADDIAAAARQRAQHDGEDVDVNVECVYRGDDPDEREAFLDTVSLIAVQGARR